ncbi:metal ABC transporter permease [Bartonella sp. DGB1]|uniref:metal ABC transporter permease n=1 Tax=Bartonella sp. DGB1 TaxID=3239807 RepID=UPI0035234694
MYETFFIYSLLSASGLALIAGPFGCLLIWRRMAYLGDTMAHSAILGIVFAFLLKINLNLAIFIIAIISALLLLFFQRLHNFSNDTILSIISHFTLALGLVIFSFMTWVRIDIMSYLFGDILATSIEDIILVWGGGVLLLLWLAKIWRILILETISPSLAQAEKISSSMLRITFTFMLAILIAIAMKIIGILLFTALLIIPASTARYFSTSPTQMAILSSIFAILSSIIGLFVSLYWDPPAAPTIVVAASCLFFITTFYHIIKKKFN